MKLDYSPGLRFRIAVMAGLVLIGFIALMDITLSSLIQTAFSRSNAGATEGPCAAEVQAASGDLVRWLRQPVLLYLCIGSALALGIILLIVNRVVVRPLSAVTRSVERVADGLLDTRVPIEGSGELVALGVSFNRMTRTIKSQQDDLRSQVIAIEAANAELKQTHDRLISAARLASVGTLAAGVAHEIGNPITGILGLLDVLETESDPEKSAQYRALIAKETRRVDHIISELLNYARPGRTGAAAAAQADVRAALDHVLQLIKAQRRFDQIEIALKLPDSLPPLAMAVEDMSQLLVNLLLNAAQAMDGTGKIQISARLPGDSRFAEIAVEDNGPGISAEDRDQIFDPFFSNRRSGDGSGLGLAICQRICERAGGTIELDFTQTTGARFVIRVPILKA